MAPNLAEADSERAVTAVLHELSNELDAGEVQDARDAMPVEVRELWPVSGL